MERSGVCCRCGHENIAGRRFCACCGARLAASCPKCGSAVPAGSQTCRYCGIRLDWAQWQKRVERAGTGARATEAAWRRGGTGGVGGAGKAERTGTKATSPELAKATRAERVAAESRATPDGEIRQGRGMGSIISWFVAVPLLLFVLFLGFVYLSPDYDMHMVTSESMVPAIKMGDLIITGPVKGEVRPGTVVTYERGRTLVTHRVISVEDGKLLTKGDAVEDPDQAPVTISEVRGVYLFKIPSLGYLANFMRSRLGWFVAIIVPSILLLGLIFYEIAREVLKEPQVRPDTESYRQRR